MTAHAGPRTRWLLARHGQSVANAGEWLSGHTDVDLTPRGEAEARALGEQLRSHRITHVVSSDLTRAARTARIALDDRPHALRTHAALRERDLGAWTGWTVRELRESGARRVLDHLDGRPPGGESLRDVACRAMFSLARWDRGEPVLVVSHGGLMRALLGLVADEVDAERLGRRYVGNAELAVLDLPLGTWEQVARGLRG